ncbi:hypothetical protein, partial [Pseudomonas koreensis]|uniref:hypothetical protein n=1 Tax=Pseudomonas koreensis TaxID=198620 RepID=UPI001B33CF0F
GHIFDRFYFCLALALALALLSRNVSATEVIGVVTILDYPVQNILVVPQIALGVETSYSCRLFHHLFYHY